MCLTIPAKVIAIKDASPDKPIRQIVVKDSKGEKELIAIMLPHIEVGDWVLYAFDAAVQKVSEEDAKEILELLEPSLYIDISSLDEEFLRIIGKASTGELRKDEIIRLLETEDPLEMEALFAEANTIRQAGLKDFFCIHGIVEFSNHCVRECHYCGLRRSSKDVPRYRMSAEEIIASVLHAVNNKGYKLIVLQSGDDFYYTDDMLAHIIKKIKARCKVFIFISVGERGTGSYKKLKKAGASGVLFRFETSNKKIYNALHPGQSLHERLGHLKAMKAMGYYIASGFLIGLPGQTVEDIANDILTMKEYGVKMVSIGPFVPGEGTPLAASPPGDSKMTLKVTAISRLLMPKAKIPVTTALETIESEEGRRMGLSSGANSLMFNLTPDKYRGDYRIYPNKFHGREEMWEKYGLYKEELSYKMLEQKMFEAFEEQGNG
ncbi:MAG: [FeFe] hydrogenase H-cluster radical SAM maturase HydE [Deltaproteobacteria bacterium]|nr:[FeFe] hydrogenase H-cluster radical SAM maturase HydE [Deltaproteobacteria bacterium]